MMRRASAVLASLAALTAACGNVTLPPRDELSSFDVEVVGIHALKPIFGEENYTTISCGAPSQRTRSIVVGYEREPLLVASTCAQAHGGQAAVPDAIRGTERCRYAIPHGELELEVKARARGANGLPLEGFNKESISFRVIPGDLVHGYQYRIAPVASGVADATVRAAHVYGPVRVWAEDAPPLAVLTEEGIEAAPAEPAAPRTFATGLSETIWFEDPSIQAVQIPDTLDNRTSPFVGQFITIGRAPESGDLLRHTCPDDPENDGKPSLLVVTGSDPQGFFVTDVTACATKELLEDAQGAFVRTPEPSGFYPGRFASMYIYNYSYPEGLFPGDALWSVSGAIQEFTSTTQMTFPAWTIAERVRERPEAEWNHYLSRVPIADLNLRLCGGDDDDVVFITDRLCGHNSRNLKLESLESGLVRLKNVRFPQKFVQCDFNGDLSVPFFCESRGCMNDDLGRTPYSWADCNFEAPSVCDPSNPSSEACERQCNIDCTVGEGAQAGVHCSEKTTYVGFGQYVVEMPGPGPAEAGLDESLPKRILSLPVSATSQNTSSKIGANTRFDFQRFEPGQEVLVYCDAPVRVAFGDGATAATSESPQLAANTLLRHVTADGELHAAVIADGDFSATSACSVSVNMKTRINVLTRDAIPDLEPDCDPDDADAERATQCRYTQAATYDVVGHLRHLQPGRPRWAVLPRDADDVCCHPGEGMACPRPLKACAAQ